MFEFEAPVDEVGIRAAERAFFLRSLRQLRFIQTFVAPPLFGTMALAGYYFHVGAWFVVVFAAFFALSVLFPVYMFFARPAAAAKVARQTPLRHVVLTSEAITISVNDHKGTLPWKRFRAVWDVGDYLLLVLTPYAAIHLQKASIPAGAQAFMEHSMGAAA